jgi:hypothetical protein
VPLRRSVLDVIPAAIARVAKGDKSWFVIGGQAVRCRFPYRPSDDVDFGVRRKTDLGRLVDRFRARGRVEVIERSSDTVHLSFDGHDVSIFVLPELLPHVKNQTLDVTGILATKLHAILDRGTRRDFFDLYVMLSEERLGISACLAALREVYASDVNEGLVWRALSYFEDAEREAPLPGEGPNDWETVKRFFAERVAAELVPPERRLTIQRKIVSAESKRRRRGR